MRSSFVCAVVTASLVCVGSAIACSPHDLAINVDWLKDNNKPDTAQIQAGCNGLSSMNVALNQIIDAFHDGQHHNPSAAASIDDCDVPTIMQYVCDRYH
jgi:hypothetical protein